MRAVVQRVTEASVSVDSKQIAAIGAGFLVLVAAEAGDTDKDALYVADKVAKLRVFTDTEGKMNLSVTQAEGAVLVVSQFTLMGDCRGQNRPSFIKAEEPEKATRLLALMVDRLKSQGIDTQTGQFQAHMQVALVNDGPVTILIDSKKTF